MNFRHALIKGASQVAFGNNYPYCVKHWNATLEGEFKNKQV